MTVIACFCNVLFAVCFVMRGATDGLCCLDTKDFCPAKSEQCERAVLFSACHLSVLSLKGCFELEFCHIPQQQQ